MISKNRQPQNQDGLASIVIVTVIIVLLSLITIGFTKVMNKEYRQATDRELASQANYAAESGMNDARNYVVSQLKTGNDPDSGGNCVPLTSAPAAGSPFVQNGSLSAFYANPNSPSAQNNTVRYTCVIIDTHPRDITTTLTKGESKVIKVVPETSINNVYFSWNNNPETSNPASLGNFPNLPEENTVEGTNKTGMLRVTVYPALNSVNTDATVVGNASTNFLYPNFVGAAGSVPSVAYGSTANGGQGNQGIHPGNCNALNKTTSNPLPYKNDGGYDCNTEINGVTSAPFYYVRLTALYQNLNVSIQATNSSSPATAVKIDDAQAVIDVTGEGNDVLKRIHARLALSSNLPLPEYTLQSMDTICKRLRIPVGPGGPNDYQSAVIDDPPSGGTDQACQPQSP